MITLKHFVKYVNKYSQYVPIKMLTDIKSLYLHDIFTKYLHTYCYNRAPSV